MKTIFKLTLTLFLFVAFASTTNAQEEQYGQASYYSDKYHGKKTASGVKYDKTKMTCAHNDYPFGSTIKVTHLENKRSVVVKVVDRGPYIKGRIVDLSRAAAGKIGLINDGVAQVKVELVSTKGKVSELSAKGDKKPTEYSTAPSRKSVEETIKKSSARATNSAKKSTAAVKSKAAATKKAKTPTAAKSGAAKVTDKDVVTAKGDDAPAALPMLTAKDLKDTDLYQISLLKPKKEGYGVQVASLGDYEGVLKKVAYLQGRFFQNIMIRTEKAEGVNVYKIILGQFETRDQANSYKKDLKKKKKISGFVVPLGEEEE